MRYTDQLKTVQWNRKRRKILDRDNHRCTQCGNIDEELHVHHIYYINGNKAWDYPDKALITLCKHCHKIWHDTNEIEIRKKVWCRNKEYEPNKINKSYKRKLKRDRKKDKITKLAIKMGLNINDIAVKEIIKNNTYSRASFLFKQLLGTIS